MPVCISEILQDWDCKLAEYDKMHLKSMGKPEQWWIYFLSSHLVLRLLTKSQVLILKNILHTSLLTANPMLTATVGNLWQTRNEVLVAKVLSTSHLHSSLTQRNPTWSSVSKKL